MSADALLSRLERVRKTGPDRWIASSPTRADKHPSLSIRELPDGRVLIHDFGGDAPLDILNAVGLDMTALFPPRPEAGLYHRHHVERRPFNAHDILACLATEAFIVADCSRQVRRGQALSDVDHARLVTACGRLADGAEMAAPGDAAADLRRRVTTGDGAAHA